MSGKWVYIALASLSGILISFEFGFISCMLLSLLIIRMTFEKERRLLISCCIAVVTFFFITEQTKHKSVSQYRASKNVHLPITFIEYPQIDGNRLKSIVVTPQKEKLMLTYTIPSEAEKNELAKELYAGKQCVVAGELVQPPQNRNEHAFNYERYLKRQDIHWLYELKHLSVAECFSDSVSLMMVLQNVRAAGIQRVKDSFPERLSTYAAALIFGDRTLMPEDVDKAYKQLGIVHLLAISGLHIGMIAGGMIIICLRLGMTRESVFWLLVVFLPVYAVLSGGNPPVIRAITMTIMLLVSKKWRLPLSTLDTLAISFILFLFFNPLLTYHIGFQLSYAVCFGLILSSSFIFQQTNHGLLQMAHTSIVSLLASFPILIYHFYEFSFLSVIANMIFIPFYTLVLLPAIFILFLFTYLPGSFLFVPAAILDQLLHQSENIARWAGSLRFSELLTGKPTMIILFLMVCGVLGYFLLQERRIHLFVSILPLLIIFAFQYISVKYSPVGEVVFIDIGQGDSILIKLPYNRGVYLIDTGGQIDFPTEDWQKRSHSYKVGKDTLIPVLKSNGIGHIDKLILTHSDADHMGAAKELIGEIAIEEVLITPNSWEKPLMAEFIHKTYEENIQVKEVKAGFGWKNKSGTFSIIFPFDDKYEGNNDSIVLYGEFGQLTWLFTGDAEMEAENEMAAAYPRLDADVLKVGHHGSRSSTTPAFAALVKPKFAIISAGVSNRYGHPHPEVLEVLENENATIFRTDQHGAIHYRFTSKRGTFKTVLPYDKPANFSDEK